MPSSLSSRGTTCRPFYPSLDGSLFLPEMVEFNAKYNPAQTFYVFYDDHTNDIRHISHLEFYRACQRLAHAVRPNRQGLDNAVVAIICNCDTILYQALTMGLIYAGLIPFPMSPRNSPAAVANMMRKTDCSRLIATGHSLGALLNRIKVEFMSGVSEPIKLDIEELPSVAYAYPNLGRETMSSSFVPYPKAAERPVDHTIMYYLHSSGSTGFPKPIPITYLTAVHWCTTPTIAEHIDFPIDLRVGGASLPPFHAIGVYVQLYYPITSLTSVCVFAPTSCHGPAMAPVFPNPQNTIEAVQRTRSNAVIAVPAFLQEWATSREAVEILSKMEYVVFGGGPLAKKTGDALVAAGVKLSAVYGATEASVLTYCFRSPAERTLWDWVRFGSNQRIRWVPQEDGLYECQVLTCPTHHVSVENLPDVKGYATSDVFTKHPTIEGLWRIVGRLDDVLVHSSSEKTVPAPMEVLIASSLFVSGVCMFGSGRNQTGVLIEPKEASMIDVTDDEQVSNFRNKIWREIEQANKEAPTFSRIFKEMILVTSRDKPMLRTGKGTVMKKATLKLYESEINVLYASVEASIKAGIDVPLPLSWSLIQVEGWLTIHATAINAGKAVDVDVDLFEQGFDSLSSTFLKNRIIGAFVTSSHKEIRSVAPRITQDIVFSKPTLRLLAAHLIQLMGKKDVSPTPEAMDPKSGIEAMITQYTVGLRDEDANDVQGVIKESPRGHVVLLTGTTGGLGSYLLASLLKREDVVVVYAFNRPSKLGAIKQRQRAAFEDRGLDTALLGSEKLIYLEGDAARPRLSLDDQTYNEIRSSVTLIVHVAWRLDFNLALSSFEPNVRGTRHLIDLARGSNRKVKPRFMFTSSVASAQGWEKSKGLFPEEVQFDARIAVGTGYGASKYVIERILAMSGLPATSFRIGQITGGSPGGAWSTTDWVPIIIKSSLALNALPEAHGVVSWLPPYAVSDVVLSVAFADETPQLAMNLVHPRPVTWASVMQSISNAIYQKRLTSTPLPLIPFSEWVERLEARAADTSEDNTRHVPAIKLLDFIRVLARSDAANGRETVVEGESNATEAVGFAGFATEAAERVSQTMRALAPISDVDATSWVEYWASVGMFSEGV